MKILHSLSEVDCALDCIYSEGDRSIEIFAKILSSRGSLWIRVSDEDMDYLKIECDSIFKRENFVTHIILETKPSKNILKVPLKVPLNDLSNDSLKDPLDDLSIDPSIDLSIDSSIDLFDRNHEFILVYAKQKELWRPNLLPRTQEMDSRYKNPDNDPRGVWIASDLSVRTYSPSGDYEIEGLHGKIFKPPASRSWSVTREVYLALLADNRIWFGRTGDSRPMRKRFLSEVQQGFVAKTIWSIEEKPLEKILQLAADQNSTVLVL